MEIILIIVSGATGIIIGQTNGFLERRHERKKALNQVLSELLEIRHRFKGSLYMIRRMVNDIELPYELYDDVISSLPDGLLWDDSITHRYNEAINILSMHAPILAYALRSKDIVKLFCNGAPVIFGTSKETNSIGLENITSIENAILPTIEESIEAVALLLGKKQCASVSNLIAETKDVLPEVSLTTDKILANVHKVLAHELNKTSNMTGENNATSS